MVLGICRSIFCSELGSYVKILKQLVCAGIGGIGIRGIQSQSLGFVLLKVRLFKLEGMSLLCYRLHNIHGSCSQYQHLAVAIRRQHVRTST